MPQGAALQPGGLVFYGTPARVYHVGMYIGEGKMVNAPTFGKPVQVAYYRYNGDDYLGATRPAATGSTTGLLPYAPPAPAAPSQPRDFPAPVAPAPTTSPPPTTSRTSGTSSTKTPTTTTTTETTNKPAETATSSKEKAASDSGDAQSGDAAVSGSDGSG